MCVSQKFLGDLCVGSPRNPDGGFLNAGTLQFTQPLLPLCFDHCLLMKSRCVLSLFLCFGLCVLILSKAHRNLLLHFPSFTSDASFSVTAATLFYDANFESQSFPVVSKVWFCGQESVLREKGTTSWPPRVLHQQLPYPVCKANGTAASETELSFCFSRHSALYGPFPLDVVADGRCRNAFEWQHNFLLKLKSRLRTTSRRYLLVRPCPGHILLVQSSYMSVTE